MHNYPENNPTPNLNRVLSFHSVSTRPHNCPNCHCSSSHCPPHQPPSLPRALSPNFKTFPSSINLNNMPPAVTHCVQTGPTYYIGNKGPNIGNIYYQRTDRNVAHININNNNNSRNGRRDSECSVSSNRSIGSNCSRNSKNIYANGISDRQRIIVSPSKTKTKTQTQTQTRVNIRYMSPSKQYNTNNNNNINATNISNNNNSSIHEQNLMIAKTSLYYQPQSQQQQPQQQQNKQASINRYVNYDHNSNSNKNNNSNSNSNSHGINHKNGNINSQTYSTLFAPVRYQSIINVDDEYAAKQPSILSRKKSIEILKSTKLSRQNSMPSNPPSLPQNSQNNNNNNNNNIIDTVIQKQNTVSHSPRQQIKSNPGPVPVPVSDNEHEHQHDQKQGTISAILSRKALKSSSLPSTKYQINSYKWGQPSACDIILQAQQERVIAGEILRDLKLNFDYFQTTDITKISS